MTQASHAIWIEAIESGWVHVADALGGMGTVPLERLKEPGDTERWVRGFHDRLFAEFDEEALRLAFAQIETRLAEHAGERSS